MIKIPNKKPKFNPMSQPSKKPAKPKKTSHKNERLKINAPFEEAIKIAFDPKLSPNKK